MRSFAHKAFIGTFFALPLFVFAQTSTSTAVQPPDPLQLQVEAQKKIDNITQDFINNLPSVQDAQTKTLSNDLSLKIAPEYPNPNESVKATVGGYLTDLNRATIAWSLNGKAVDRGTGEKTFSFQAGDSGKKTTVGADIYTESGDHFYKEFSFTPVGTAILWEADTYTPPFYKGKPLLTPESQVRVIALSDAAIAQGVLGAGSLIYEWEKDGSTMLESSGYGKNTFSFLGPKPFGKAGVSVKVSSLNGVRTSRRSIDIPLASPVVLFYEDHPLLGTWYNRTLGNEFSLTKKEFSINAEPYFFSNETTETTTFLYNWSVNGKKVVNPGRTITLRNDEGTKGDSLLALAMRGLKKTFQSSNQSLLVHFTTEQSAQPTF